MDQSNHLNEKQKKEVNGLWVLLFFALMFVAVGILAKFTS